MVILLVFLPVKSEGYVNNNFSKGRWKPCLKMFLFAQCVKSFKLMARDFNLVCSFCFESCLNAHRCNCIFLVFALKHRLWILVRGFRRNPQFIVKSKNKKNINIFRLKFVNFTALKIRRILHKHVMVRECYIANIVHLFSCTWSSLKETFLLQCISYDIL